MRALIKKKHLRYYCPKKTHDPHTAFMAKQRIVMEAGAIKQVIQRSRTEEETFHQLSKEYRKQKNLQDAIRNGACF